MTRTDGSIRIRLSTANNSSIPALVPPREQYQPQFSYDVAIRDVEKLLDAALSEQIASKSLFDVFLTGLNGISTQLHSNLSSCIVDTPWHATKCGARYRALLNGIPIHVGGSRISIRILTWSKCSSSHTRMQLRA